MSKLIQMRRRIKAIETIKKVTHTMRLISMASHSRLKKQLGALAEYVTAIETMFTHVSAPITESIATPSSILPSPTEKPRILLIVVGSQKGLCGNFNNTLFNQLAIDPYFNTTDHYRLSIIAIGQKAVNEIKKKAPASLIESYEQFTTHTFLPIAHNLITHITNTIPAYTQVILWSNRAKNFFSQTPERTVLFPFTPTSRHETSLSHHEQYVEEYGIKEITQILTTQLLEARTEQLLFESLLAEQAARFISMDASTRNAKTILEEMQLQYNKIRQAKITKELTELTSSS